MNFATQPRVLAAAALALGLFTLDASADSPTPPTTAQAPNGSVLMAWTQVIGNSSSAADVLPLDGVARFILQGTDTSGCAKYKLGYTTASASVIAYTSAVATRANPDVTKFPVSSCEFSFDPAWTSAKLYRTDTGALAKLYYYDTGGKFHADGTVSFPTLYELGRKNNGSLRLVTTADSGCRNNSDKTNKNYQLCTSAQWPFQAVIASMAGYTPDLIIHSGDLRYRGQHVSDSVDSWADWYQDFFYPATQMLRGTVWAVTRGNHELCSGDTNAGNGWYMFMDHHPAAANATCASQPSPVPWYFDVAVKKVVSGQLQAVAPHRFILLDTSDADNATVANFKTMNELADAATDTAWWAMHRPIWGISTDGGLSTRTGTLQRNLHTAMGGTGDAHPDCNPGADNDNGWLGGKWSFDKVSCHLRTALSGHSHMLEISRFYKNKGDTGGIWQRPQQALNGHGGVNLDPSLKASPCTKKIDNMSSTIKWGAYWGYIYWQRASDIAQSGNQSGWNMNLIQVQGDKPTTTNSPSGCEVQ